LKSVPTAYQWIDAAMAEPEITTKQNVTGDVVCAKEPGMRPQSSLRNHQALQYRRVHDQRPERIKKAPLTEKTCLKLATIFCAELKSGQVPRQTHH